MTHRAARGMLPALRPPDPVPLPIPPSVCPLRLPCRKRLPGVAPTTNSFPARHLHCAGLVVTLTFGGRPAPFGLSPLREQNAVTILRPVVHNFFDLQPCGAQFLYHNLLLDAVPAPVARNSFHRFQPRARRKVNNRQPPSGLQ